jgi:hypothetical protein
MPDRPYALIERAELQRLREQAAVGKQPPDWLKPPGQPTATERELDAAIKRDMAEARKVERLADDADVPDWLKPGAA